ncbi:MAG: 4-hydroxythreonine-4-phosphate dehydrogenase PdxA [Pseudomonadota bacterium]
MTPLLINTGEPAGIGPELCVRLALQQPHHVLVGDAGLIQHTATALGASVALVPWQPGTVQRVATGVIQVLPISLAAPAVTGQLNPANARYILRCLDACVEHIQHDGAAGLVTAPVHKGVINDAGITFSGHTEYLAGLAQTERVVMMLAADSLRVALATTHLPLRQVADAIDQDSLTDTLRILARDLRVRFGLAQPRIAVLGLNPHAGEDGHLGHEELDVILPVMDRLRQQGMDLIGPLPADTAFVPKHLEQVDAVLAMYHDQGLPVLKYAGFGHAVNVTLGLPFVRTSVDHGTALDIAGQGIADTGSLLAAVAMAEQMVVDRSH